MQLSNIARDVGEDARNGRIYLPLGWLAEAGIDPEAFLAKPRHSPPLGRVVARLLEAAEQHYRQASAGIARLPIGCRFGIGAAALLYAEIGREVGRRNMDAVSGRAVVPVGRKVGALVDRTRRHDAATPTNVRQLRAGGRISRRRSRFDCASTGLERRAGAVVGHGRIACDGPSSCSNGWKSGSGSDTIIRPGHPPDYKEAADA